MITPDTCNCVKCTQGIRRARAEVLAAAVQMGKDWQRLTINQFAQKYKVDTDDLPTALATLQPAASALEALLEQAHEAGAVIAGEQLLKALTEEGEFAVGSPLDKIKKRVEELLREERGLFGLALEALAELDFAAADILAQARFETWQGVKSEAEKARASEGDRR